MAAEQGLVIVVQQKERSVRASRKQNERKCRQRVARISPVAAMCNVFVSHGGRMRTTCRVTHCYLLSQPAYVHTTISLCKHVGIGGRGSRPAAASDHSAPDTHLRHRHRPRNKTKPAPQASGKKMKVQRSIFSFLSSGQRRCHSPPFADCTSRLAGWPQPLYYVYEQWDGDLDRKNTSVVALSG